MSAIPCRIVVNACPCVLSTCAEILLIAGRTYNLSRVCLNINARNVGKCFFNSGKLSDKMTTRQSNSKIIKSLIQFISWWCIWLLRVNFVNLDSGSFIWVLLKINALDDVVASNFKAIILISNFQTHLSNGTIIILR